MNQPPSNAQEEPQPKRYLCRFCKCRYNYGLPVCLAHYTVVSSIYPKPTGRRNPHRGFMYRRPGEPRGIGKASQTKRRAKIRWNEGFIKDYYAKLKMRLLERLVKGEK